MQLINESDKCDDYVVATNTQCSVRKFLEMCCNTLDYNVEFVDSGINEKCIDKKTGNTLAYVDSKYYRASDVNSLQGNFDKINKKLGWSPTIYVEELASIMTKYDFKNEWKSS